MSTELIAFVKDVAALLVIFLSGAAAVFVFFRLSPVLSIRVLPRWTDETQQYLVVRFEIENKSRVRANKPTGQIQVLEFAPKPGIFLSHGVPFDANTIREEERPIEWREPVRIFHTTKQIFPGELVSFERLYHYPQANVIVHIGLQVGLELGSLGRITNLKRESWRQTVTCFAVKQSKQEQD